MLVVGGIGMTTTVQKLWCFSQPEAISHDGIPNLKRRDKTCMHSYSNARPNPQ